MNVKPEYMSFGELFKNNNIFYTPPYQRDYSWEEEQIEQFCSDIKESLSKKSQRKNFEHFFGGVVCAQENSLGGNRGIENLLVDGQQRLSTIVLFFSVVRAVLNDLECKNETDNEYRKMISNDIYKYFIFEEREHREINKRVRVSIGQADNDFYQGVIEGPRLESTRNSHNLILNAEKYFHELFINDLFLQKDTSECLEILDEIVKLFEESFLVIHIVTNSIDEAYKLFTVLNDRGINLTEGELLKAHTIGMCGKSTPYTRKITDDWDIILKHPPKKVTDYLRWIIIMIVGKNVKSSSVLEEYKHSFLEESLSLDELAKRVGFIRKCVDKLEYISEGEWPFDDESKNWNKGKLDLLINKLKHKFAMPLLLAASFSDPREFKNIVNETYKFFIRYKMISSLHASLFSTLYSALAKKIYSTRDRFSIKELHDEFNKVIEQKDPDDMNFINGIRGLMYQRKGDNKPIKCLLISIQENWSWLMQPCQGTSQNRLKKEDESIFYDFNNTTLEHLYPYSSSGENKSLEMEKIKNTIGNIVILDPGRNSRNENKPFNEKKDSFANTGIGIHSLIVDKDDWTELDIKELTEKYIEYAVKVFSFR
ncbi:DUF262 domain-containing protein [Xenorhabdus szentirmaii]|uniref:DUF262 domain-containing protein n=1 Tax=Xenorhabdus szentirmaii TaxID=290112 RepID=UPI0019BD449C|nr:MULTISPECIES: DUF262 domain-containing HNH endonuclease family protein [unclassified Xenorhabdus]MBD2792565.1 DUF262 domain-containing protein [Xenorhabdus sp. CUL]MBD2823512.1 DUF262 domain-containing protein [Xenorhabdus sp. 5]